MKITISFVCTALFLFTVSVGAEVNTVRQLPESGEHTTRAERLPYPAEATGAVVPGRGVDFSGRIVIGGLAGSDEAGEFLYDIVTDSEAVFRQDFSIGGSFDIAANATRQNSFGELEGEYGLTSSLDLAKFGLDVEAMLLDTVQDTREQGAALGASISLLFLETLPVNATYSYNTATELDDELSIIDQWDQLATLSATGTVGQIALTAATTFTTKTDSIKRFESQAMGGEISVGIPIGVVNLGISAEPSYAGTTYLDTNNSTASATLESAVDIAVAPFETLTFSLNAGRNDEWAKDIQQIVPTESHSASWIGGISFDLLAESGFQSSAGYAFATYPAEDTDHTLEAAIGIKPASKSLLVSAKTSGRVELLSRAQWEAAATIAPFSSMTLAAEYEGGYSWDTTPEELHNGAAIELAHKPAESFSYTFSGNISNARSGAAPHIEAETSAHITMVPWRVFTLNFGETIGIVRDQPSGEEFTVFVTESGIKVPIGRSVGLRYDFGWNRVLAALTTDVLRHRAGLSVTPESSPVEFSTEYSAVSGGTLNQEILSSFSILFAGGFGIQASYAMKIADYETGERETPFNFKLQGSLAF